MNSPRFALIESFLAFVDAENMSQAAGQIGLSQPALTQHLQAFEACFQQDVFVLQGRRKRLTKFGLELSEILKLRFRGLNEELFELSQKHEKPANAMARIAGRAEILKLVGETMVFEGALVFRSMSGDQAVDEVLARRAEIAISNHLRRASDLIGKKLFSDRFVLLLPRRWYKRSPTFTKQLLEELATRPYLSYKDRDENLESLLTSFKLRSSPRFAKIINDWAAIATMVSEDQGWTICPERYASPKSHLAIALPPSLIAGTDFYVLYRREVSKMPWFTALLKELNSAVARQI